MQGQQGNDSLRGGAGNDVLYGHANYNAGATGANNSDTYDGGSGNDALRDYESSEGDVYRLGVGGGVDDIVDWGGAADRIEIGAGVLDEQLWFRRLGADLEVSVIGTGDRMQIVNWYAAPANRIEQFQTSDGRMLLDGQVQNLVDAMASFAPPAAGETTLSSSYRDALGSTIAANWQPPA